MFDFGFTFIFVFYHGKIVAIKIKQTKMTAAVKYRYSRLRIYVCAIVSLTLCVHHINRLNSRFEHKLHRAMHIKQPAKHYTTIRANRANKWKIDFVKPYYGKSDSQTIFQCESIRYKCNTKILKLQVNAQNAKQSREEEKKDTKHKNVQH